MTIYYAATAAVGDELIQLTADIAVAGTPLTLRYPPPTGSITIDGNGHTLTGGISSFGGFLGSYGITHLKNLVVDLTPPAGYRDPDWSLAGPMSFDNVALQVHDAAQLGAAIYTFDNYHSASLTIRLAGDIRADTLMAVSGQGGLTIDFQGHSVTGQAQGTLDSQAMSWINNAAIVINSAADLTKAINLFNSLGSATRLLVTLGADIADANLPSVTGGGVLNVETAGNTLGASVGSALSGPHVVLLLPLIANTAAELAADIAAFDGMAAGNHLTIQLGGDITLATDLPLIDGAGTLTIDGAKHTLSGGGSYRGLFDYDSALVMRDLTIDSAVARGGQGGSGLAGAGLGGAWSAAAAVAAAGSAVAAGRSGPQARRSGWRSTRPAAAPGAAGSRPTPTAISKAPTNITTSATTPIPFPGAAMAAAEDRAEPACRVAAAAASGAKPRPTTTTAASSPSMRWPPASPS